MKSNSILQAFLIISSCMTRSINAFINLSNSVKHAEKIETQRYVASEYSSKSQISSSTSTSLCMGLTLYGSPGSRSPLVDWCAYELNIPFDRATDLSSNPHPFKQIPCLVDDSTNAVVFESGSILIHLLNMAKDIDIDDKKKAAITSWIVWANASLDPICFLETPEGKVYDTGLKKPNRRIDTIDEMLSKQTYLLGDEFTSADVAVAAYLLYVPQFFQDIDLSRWPNVVRYMKDCAGREMYGKAFGPRVQQFLIQQLDAMGKNSDKKILGLF